MYVTACPRDPLTKVSSTTHTNYTYSYFRMEPNEFPARVSSLCAMPNDNKVNQAVNQTLSASNPVEFHVAHFCLKVLITSSEERHLTKSHGISR